MIANQALHQLFSDNSFLSSCLGFQAMLWVFGLDCTVHILCMLFTCSEINIAVSCGTLSCGIREWAMFYMPGILIWKKKNPHLSLLPLSVFVCVVKGQHLLSKTWPSWPGKAEVVLSSQEGGLILALLHWFSSVSVLRHTQFQSNNVF